MPLNPDDPYFVLPREIIQDPVPPWFDPEKLELYDRHQITSWDETHPKCDLQKKAASGVMQNKKVWQVPRDDV